MTWKPLNGWSGRSLNQLDYAEVAWDNRRKQLYRRHCIIENYRWLSGNSAVPGKQQYWTICGNHVKKGSLLPGSELSQMVDEELISTKQFHGVDSDATIITANRAALPGANWYHGDFSTVVNRAENFDPAIVHIDTIHMFKTAAEISRGAITRLEHCEKPVMLVVNVVLKRPVDKVRNDPMGFLNKFESLVTAEWLVKDEIYIYQGAATKRSSTHLATYVFQFPGRGTSASPPG